MMKVFITIFLTLVFLPLSASAVTYYVDVTGNDSYNGLYPTYEGGSNGPWLTLAKSVSSISSGDTVYLRAGTWNEGLYIYGKSYTSRTTFARYPSDPVGSVILDGTGIEHEEWEDGVILIHYSNNVLIDGIKVINGYKAGINAVSGQYIEILNSITDNTYLSGIAFWLVTHGTVQGNTIYNSNMPNGYDEVISIASSSTNIDVSYNTLYAGNRNFGAMGGEGLNIKDGCSYVHVHHNYVDMARPDGQESDRYAMGVDGWTSETHHIYFYNNIVKDGSWGLQCNSEEGGYAHHIYFYNNIVSHIGHGSMHGGGIGFPPYGGSPGLNEYIYWWNNIIYDSYYGARFYKEEIASVEMRNNIFYNSEIEDIHFDTGVPEEEITLDHNLYSGTDPKFVNASGEDFHLQSDSPAINAGVTISNVIDDFDGISRPQGAGYDIGAYEYVSSLPPSNCSDGTPHNGCSANRPLYCDNGNLVNRCSVCGCPANQVCLFNETCQVISNVEGDLNNDGIVDILDLALIALHFGQKNTHPQWNATIDIIVNGEIDIFDIVFVASRFSYSISISCVPSSGGTNNIVNVPISIARNQNEIQAFGLNLTYNASMFQFINVSSGTLTRDWYAVDGNEISPGAVIIGGFMGAANPIPIGSSDSIAMVNFIVTCSGCSGGRQGQICISDYLDDIANMTPQSLCTIFNFI
jgi:hypothetical protein